MSDSALLVDIGSTYTKMISVDVERKLVTGRSAAPTTVDLWNADSFPAWRLLQTLSVGYLTRPPAVIIC